MDRLPPEILDRIFDGFDFTTITALRQVCRLFAGVGAKYLMTEIRFHCSKESLIRLRTIAEHPIFSKCITAVTFEGNILADVGCEHSYARHYDLEHHRDEMPQPPPRNCSSRERRLYERNLAKFRREVSGKYQRYRSAVNAQTELFKSEDYLSMISSSMTLFPKLEKIKLFTIGRCRHVLSQRFMEEYAIDCAMPMDSDSTHTTSQFRSLIFPTTFINLKTLEVHVLSPKVFADTSAKPTFIQVFRSLKTIDLSFRTEKQDRDELVMGVDNCYQNLSNGVLAEALAAAQDLQELTINFDDYGYYGSCVDMNHVLGQSVWPELKQLDLDSMSTTDELLLTTLARQPALRKLRLGFFTLSKGVWTYVITALPKKVQLTEFRATGLLEDSEQLYSMHYIDADAYMEEYLEMSVSDLLDMYVTDSDYRTECHMPFSNPLIDHTFEDPDELRAEFGSPTDSDSITDSDVPDLAMDCD